MIKEGLILAILKIENQTVCLNQEPYFYAN
ncbi:hypothetical protein GILI108418_08245 [Gillisia limnaea]